MELRVLPGDLILARIVSLRTLAAWEVATAQASRIHCSGPAILPGSLVTSPIGPRAADVESATGARNTSLLHSKVCSSSKTLQSNPKALEKSLGNSKTIRPCRATLKRNESRAVNNPSRGYPFGLSGDGCRLDLLIAEALFEPRDMIDSVQERNETFLGSVYVSKAASS
jgi:hypothetical protein